MYTHACLLSIWGGMLNFHVQLVERCMSVRRLLLSCVYLETILYRRNYQRWCAYMISHRQNGSWLFAGCKSTLTIYCLCLKKILLWFHTVMVLEILNKTSTSCCKNTRTYMRCPKIAFGNVE